MTESGEAVLVAVAEVRDPVAVGSAGVTMADAAASHQVDDALDGGWNLARICRVLEVPTRWVHRWRTRRADGELTDRKPGGQPVHSILQGRGGGDFGVVRRVA